MEKVFKVKLLNVLSGQTGTTRHEGSQGLSPLKLLLSVSLNPIKQLQAVWQSYSDHIKISKILNI